MRYTRLAAIVCASILVLGAAQPAAADDTDDSITILTILSPGASREFIAGSLRDYANAHGLKYEDVVHSALIGAMRSVVNASGPEPEAGSIGGAPSDAGAPSSTNAPTSTGAPGNASEFRAQVHLPTSSGGAVANLTLGDAENNGDIFISAASTFGAQHGHTGIYADKQTIVEAPGINQTSRTAAAGDTLVAKGAVKQRVNVSQDQRDAAANYARDNLVGKGYNINFAVNKDANGSEMNCSQLVWAAYMKADGLDLDGNGGFGVFPYDIKDSSHVTTYETL